MGYKKPASKSKTVWFGGLLLSGGIAQLIINLLESQELTDFLLTIPTEYQGIAVATIGLIVVILRFSTDTRIE